MSSFFSSRYHLSFQEFQGTITVECSAGWNWENALGSITKQFYVSTRLVGNRTAADPFFVNDAHYTEVLGNTKYHYGISDVKYDVEADRYYIR